MSTFICHKCGCVDNTACGGTYWSVKMNKHRGKNEGTAFKDDFYDNNPVCTVCAPVKFADGSENEEAGKWDSSFERHHWSEYYSDLEKLKLAQAENKGTLVNAKLYAELVEKWQLDESTKKSW